MQVCVLCRLRSAVARVQGTSGESVLCAQCLRARLGAWGGCRFRADQFWELLVCPREPSRVLPVPTLPPDLSCGACGLKFQEFARIGLAGCPGCYVAFRKAIVPALAALGADLAQAFE